VASRHRGSGAEDAPEVGRETPGSAARLPGRGRVETPDRRTPTDPPIRDPGLYALTDHFRERLGQPGRYVSIRAASEAISRGQLRYNTADGWRFALVEGGVRFLVVVGDTETASPVVVTGWTEVADREAAMASDRWTAADVHTIRLRADLSAAGDRPIPGRIRPRRVERPFVIGSHRATTRPGDDYVECADCGGRFRSKGALLDRSCPG
jgi:hypothetical protein